MVKTTKKGNQTRRSISISGPLYALVQRRCAQQQLPLSKYITQLIEADLGVTTIPSFRRTVTGRLSAVSPHIANRPKTLAELEAGKRKRAAEDTRALDTPDKATTGRPGPSLPPPSRPGTPFTF